MRDSKQSNGANTPLKQKVLVALSGGVDSSVAVLLLKREGYGVEGGFMKNWDETLAPQYYRTSETGCSTKADQEDARMVAEQLQIPFHIFNFTREYYARVIEDFFSEYRKGRTPNPDILCNKYIKFGLFLEKAEERGFDYIATGHYARKKITNQESGITNELLKGKDQNKDQSYFLWTLKQEQLKYCLFPIGEYEKKEIREIANRENLVTADKPDSQGICFVGEVDVRGFLESELGKNPGPMVTVEGLSIGKHEGLHFYTIGQRHGINVGGGIPYYVVDKRKEDNALIVAKGAHHPALYASELVVDGIHWITDEPVFPLRCFAKIRYRQKDQACVVRREFSSSHVDQITAIFDEPQRAITPGQSIVFYDGEVCLGGGMIR